MLHNNDKAERYATGRVVPYLKPMVKYHQVDKGNQKILYDFEISQHIILESIKSLPTSKLQQKWSDLFVTEHQCDIFAKTKMGLLDYVMNKKLIGTSREAITTTSVHI